MQEESTFEGECMLMMRNLKDVNIQEKKFVGDKRERDEEREREREKPRD